MTMQHQPEPPHPPEPATEWIDWTRAERERHRGVHFFLNASFVKAVGEDTAQAFQGILIDVGRRLHQHSRASIAQELRDQMGALGLRPHPVELEKFADEIARADWVRATDADHVP